RRNPARHADRPRRQRGWRADRRKSPERRGTLLPADARLPRAIAAGMAHSQTEGDAPRPGRIAAGGSGGGVERPAGEPADPVAVPMGSHPLPDAEEDLDPTTAENDGYGGAVSFAARGGHSAGAAAPGVRRLRGLRTAACRIAGRFHRHGGNGGRARSRETAAG